MERIRRKEAFELLKNYPSKSLYEGVRDKDKTLEDIIAKVDKKDINCSARVTKMTDMFLRFSDGRYTVFKGEYFKFYYTEGNYLVIEEILPTAEKYVYVYYLNRHSEHFELYKQTVDEMIRDREGNGYIRTYINDLFRGKHITQEEFTELRRYLINNVEDASFGTI